MTVHFIGAGPGAADLITVRGLRLIERCPVCLYAGSLVPRDIVAAAPPDARIVDTAPLTLDEIIAEIATAHAQGLDIARRAFRRSVALWRDRRADAAPRRARHPLRCDARRAVLCRRRGGIRLRIDPPGSGADRDPDAHRDPLFGDARGGGLDRFAATGATLAIHLSITNLARIVRELLPYYGADCPAIVAYRVSWPDQQLIRGTLADIREQAKAAGITRTALILVGPALGPASTISPESRLYAPAHYHLMRPRRD